MKRTTRRSALIFAALAASFASLSPDGKKLVFASNRHGAQKGDTNIFIADWAE